MSKKYTLLLAATLLLVSTASYAQNNFRPGYIVGTAGDTIRGEVAYQDAKKASLNCQFRTSTGETTLYSPLQLRGYGYANDKDYQASRVSTSHLATDTTTQRYFLERLVKGSLSLYFSKDATGKDLYYIQAVGGPLQPLRSWQETVYDQQGKKYYQKRAEYRNTLASAMSACPAMQPDIPSLSFQLSRLVGLVERYNQCVGGPQQVSTAVAGRRSKFILTAVAGGQLSTIDFSNRYIIQGDFKSKVGPALGLALEVRTPFLDSRVAVILEALYSSQNNQGDFATNITSRIYGQAKIDLAYLRVPLMLRYSLTKGTVRPYLMAGVGSSFNVGGAQESRFSFTAPPNPQYSKWMPIFANSSEEAEFRGLENSVLFGLGVSTARPGARNIGLELRGERGNGFSLAAGIPTTVSRVFLLLRYDLTK